MADDGLRPDIQAAADRMGSKFGAKREIRRLIDHLWEDEVVQHLAGGFYGPGIGVVALTNRRLLFLKDGVMSKATEDFPLDKISSVQWNSGLVQGTLTVFASGNKAEITNIHKDDGKRIAEAIRNRDAARPEPESAPQPPPLQPEQQAPDIAGQLTRLWQLVQDGALTREEFEAAKARLIGSPRQWPATPGHAPGGPQPRPEWQ